MFNNTTSLLGPSPQLPSTLFRVVFWCGLGVVEAFSLLGNAIIIYIIITHKNLHTNTNWFLLSLAINDLGVPLFIIPSHLLCTETGLSCNIDVITALYNFVLFASVLNLCACTTERYIAILHPFKYIHLVNQKRVIGVLIKIWSLPLPLSILPVILIPNPKPGEPTQLVNRIYWLTQVMLFMIIPSAVMMAAFWRIHRVATWHANQIRRLSLVPEEDAHGGRQKLVLEAKSTLKVYGVVVLVFTLGWLLSAYRMIKTKFLLHHVPIEVDYISRFLLVSNASINPYIYGLQKSDIKKEFLTVLRKRHLHQPNSSASNANSGNEFLRNDADAV
ncbi:beta-1 adrenergic receptor-like [Dendronephthya gigantea]|uniref:beta-1 adrenergic receptor-like n=1 Tax=Dendronephthya gigantea TaxID=151771 RepID=UPI00106904D1|nr:beta-1 adrenergic receptor-like [Dendronephthya gigantea]